MQLESIWQYPVKTMIGGLVLSAELDEIGIVGDRTWAVRDEEAGAIANTRKRLDTDRLLDRVTLQVGRHEHMHEVLPDSLRHEIRVFMFNLGYLPGGDKAFTTRAESTVQALKTALRWLAPGGFISILAYRGHEGGPEEAGAVEAWLRALPAEEYELLRCDVPNAPDHAPVLYLVRKKKSKGL